MNKTLCIIATLAVSGCSTTTTQPQEIEATRDFVAANELEEVDEIRLDRQLTYNYVNDRYATVPTRRGDYLLEFQRNCHELRKTSFDLQRGDLENNPMVDVRDNTNLLRSKFDTIRGCRIAKMYEISDEQKEELKALGDAPGDEVFMNDEE